MDFRIIEITRKKEKRDVKIQILLRREGLNNVYVEVSVYGCIRRDRHVMENINASRAFIRDFSKRSANEFYSRKDY